MLALRRRTAAAAARSHRHRKIPVGGLLTASIYPNERVWLGSATTWAMAARLALRRLRRRQPTVPRRRTPRQPVANLCGHSGKDRLVVGIGTIGMFAAVVGIGIRADGALDTFGIGNDAAAGSGTGPPS